MTGSGRQSISLSILLVACDCWLSAGSDKPNSLVRFRDVALQSGISFSHDNASTAEKYMIETMGAGCGWIDFDNDGWLDLYYVNSAPTKIYTPSKPIRSALYRNDGKGGFIDVTIRAGVGAEGLFGMGMAAGDYNNDGWSDLFVAGYSRSILYRNNRDGTFSDATSKAGVHNEGRWASSAAWFDYNRDGHLDLVIANYVDWSPDKNIACGERKPGYRAYCHPNTYRGQRPTLYRNNGDGTFTDVSSPSGLGSKSGSGLGIVTFDYDGDGYQDIFIANDAMANFLFRNRGDGTFEEVAITAGVALSDDGMAEAGMGTDAADTTGSGRLDIFVTHLDFEHARLYRNTGDGTFRDATFDAKLGYATYQYSGFGTRFLDYDNDGHRDIFLANGHILENIGLYHAKIEYAEPKLVFRNDGSGRFVDVTAGLGPDLAVPRVSRGAAVADFDNDGDLDVAVSNNGESAQLFRNDGGNRNHWLLVRLIGSKSNRDGVGAKVMLRVEGKTLFDERKGGGSYQSAHDPRVHFGLGAAMVIESVEVRWPSGIIDRLTSIAADQTIVVREGSQAAASPGRYQIGLVAQSRGDWQSSIRHLEEAVRLNPDFVEAKYALSRSCQEVGDLEGAVQMLRDVVGHWRNNAEARLNLALALWRLGKPHQEVLRELRIASAIDPDNPRIRLALGEMYSEKNDYTRASEELRRAVELAPTDPEAHYNLGLSLRLSGQLERAIVEFRRAIELNPAHGQARKALGLVMRQQGNYPAAKTELEAASVGLPQDAEVRQVLGAVLIRTGDHENAQLHLDKAVQMNPVLYEAWYQLAQLQSRFGNEEAAKKAQAQGHEAERLKRAASESLVQYRIAEESLSRGDRAGAIAALRAAVRVSPDFADGAYRLSELLTVASKSASERERLLRQVLEIRPTHAHARADLGILLLDREESTEGAKLLRRAVEQAPSLTAANHRLLQLAERNRDWTTAAEHARRVLAWAPNDRDAQLALQRAETLTMLTPTGSRDD